MGFLNVLGIMLCSISQTVNSTMTHTYTPFVIVHCMNLYRGYVMHASLNVSTCSIDYDIARPGVGQLIRTGVP